MSACLCPGQVHIWRSRQDAPPVPRRGPVYRNFVVDGPAQQGTPPTFRGGCVHTAPRREETPRTAKRSFDGHTSLMRAGGMPGRRAAVSRERAVAAGRDGMASEEAPPRRCPRLYGSGKGELLSPCRCSGSVRCTHQPCLIKWISERGSWSCELCYYKYHVIAISTKNPLQWQTISLTVIEKVQIAAAILGSLFLLASISWLIWSSLSPSAKWQRQDLLFQICYGMYGFMDVVCIEGHRVEQYIGYYGLVENFQQLAAYMKRRESLPLLSSVTVFSDQSSLLFM
ncbi:MARH4 ligase, partial [Polypterus senegalus]